MLNKMKRSLAVVFERDPAARNTLEVLTNYPGVHAVFWHRIAHGLWHRRCKWPARMISTMSRLLTGIEIHPGAVIGQGFFIDHGMGVVIGETAQVGDDCTLYHGVTLGGTSWQKGKRHPTLENGVVVGAGAKILGPITIGESARIGSNAVVTKDVPAGATAVGIPARIITAKKSSVEQQREATARKIGFNAYGETPNMPDPVAQAIHAMLDHIHAMDTKIETMCQAIKSINSSQQLGDSLPELICNAFEDELDEDG